MLKKITLGFFVLIFCFSVKTYGQDVKQRESFDKGNIMSSDYCYLKDNDYYISNIAYDNKIVGVSTGNSHPKKLSDLVTDKGIAEVKFNNSNGKIFEGDLVTSSNVPGEAMKATDSGMILGIALEDAGTTSREFVKVRISIQFIVK